MKKILSVIPLFSLIFLSYACSGDGQSGQKQTSHNTHSAPAEMKMEASEPTAHSIYNVSSTWQNRHGETIKLDSLQGKIQVMAMVYTHCEYACPRILADMKRIKDALSEKALQATHFTIVSIDPKRDTPRRLRNFATENNLSEEKWTLLRGSQGDILELAALLGIKYKRISETDFVHSNIITVLNRRGEIVHQQLKLGDQPERTVHAIEEMAE